MTTIKLTSDQVLKQNQIIRSAEYIFDQFHKDHIGLYDFELMIIGLAQKTEKNLDTPDKWFIEVVEEQFKEYGKDPVKNNYLLSLTSSGSLLYQFALPDEYEMV